MSDKHHGPGFMTNQAAPKTGSIARDGAPKRHQDVALHNGMKPQPAGGRGHPVGAAPIDAGGQPVASGVHPFAKPPSDGFKSGKRVNVKAGMRNRSRSDNLHGGVHTHDQTTDDPADVLATAVRSGGRAFDCGD